jgi:folate-dependent phosphoribosylglycinamide formyltransferase PurN
MARIVVFTNGNYQARLILEQLFAERCGDIAGVAVMTGDYFGRSGWNALRAISKVTAFPYLMAKIFQMAAIRIASVLAPGAIFSVRRLADWHGVPCIASVSVNDSAIAKAVEDWQGDLLISVSCPQKIPDMIVMRFPFGGINIHSSLLPRFAGLAPYYWVLAEGERTTGTTVHYLTPKFDDGHVLAVRELAIRPGESAFGLFERLCIEGRSALCEAVTKAERGDAGEAQPRRGRSYRSNPSMASYRRLRNHGHAIISPGQLLSMLRREMRARPQASSPGRKTS